MCFQDIRSRHDVRENKGNPSAMPGKIKENQTRCRKRYNIQARCRRKQRKSRRDAEKDKRKQDTMPKNRGFGHDTEEPPERLRDLGTMSKKTKEIWVRCRER